MLGDRTRQKDRTTIWKQKDQYRSQQRRWTGITKYDKRLSPKLVRTADSSTNTGAEATYHGAGFSSGSFGGGPSHQGLQLLQLPDQ